MTVPLNISRKRTEDISEKTCTFARGTWQYLPVTHTENATGITNAAEEQAASL